jgi:hypothetical protein
VLDKNGVALPGATITIVDHPEFGQTLSRLDESSISPVTAVRRLP